jgi:hypothetical protein
MAKANALQKIESHEKLCRIMQKLTHDKIHAIEDKVKRLEKILLICTGFCSLLRSSTLQILKKQVQALIV